MLSLVSAAIYPRKSRFARVTRNFVTSAMEGEMNDEVWQEFVNIKPLKQLSRLYYFRHRFGIGDRKSELAQHISGMSDGGLPGTDLEIVGTATAEEYTYLFFMDSGRDEQVTSVAILRPETDLICIRARSLETAETTFDVLVQTLPDSDRYRWTGTRPDFDSGFHERFSDQLVDRYSQIWIQFGTESEAGELSKAHFIAEDKRDARESDQVERILSDSSLDARIIGGRVSASGLSIESGTSFYFQWQDRKITFHRRPTEATKLAVSDAISRVFDQQLSPPVDRVFRPADGAIRTEFYPESYASTWQSQQQLADLLEICHRLDMDPETDTIRYLDDDQVELESLAMLADSNISGTSFLRVNGDPAHLTWESSLDRETSNIGIVTEHSDAEPLNRIYRSLEGVSIGERVDTAIQDLLYIPDLSQ